MIQIDRNIVLVLGIASMMTLLMFLLHLPFGKDEAKGVIVIYGIYALIICALYVTWRFLFEL